MNIKELEKVILEKLDKGLLDGVVGDNDSFIVDDAVLIIRFIRKGIPQKFIAHGEFEHFNGKENVRVSGRCYTEYFRTPDEKLFFLQKYGFLMDDPDVRKYSEFFSRKNK